MYSDSALPDFDWRQLDAVPWGICIRAFATPAQRSNDIEPLVGVMGQVAAGLISGPTYRNAPTSFSRGMIPAGLVEGILRGVLR